ncbi:potassium channel family protein [Gorillibacterium timonense]|uniref:potassium channel family protein n=1 Tax=Gorillibacterium timonense TaxID=1689269 RepID=UPI00071C2700|nr:TrkA family potassium uptake protein [Gorillibacterium timonense]
MKKQFAIIGIGRFGSSVALSLTQLGYEVLAVDPDESKIQAISQWVTHAVQADPTEEEALRAIGIRNFDVVVVAIGQDIQASILTTLILKELGVKMLIVKAQNELHGKVLRKIGADKVIFPERDMGQRLAHALISPNILDFIELSDNYSIVEIRATPLLIGKSLKQLDIRAVYGCNVMAIKSIDGKMNITPSADDLIQATDILIVVGRNDDLNRFEKNYSE